MDEVLNRLDKIEMQLAALLKLSSPTPESDWIDSRELCRLVGLRDRKALVYQMSKGFIRGEAVRNIGTVKRPRYRFHRQKAVDQFLNRSANASERSPHG
jgi:hypothetical protein